MDGTLLQNIAAARSLPYLAPGERLTRYASLADLLDQRALELADQECLVFRNDAPDGGEDGPSRRVWTYAEFTADVRRVAHWLRVQGIGGGDRIATISDNHAETVVQYFAAWLVGAVVVPINVGEDDERIGYILADSQAKLAFVRAPFIARIEALRTRSPGPLSDLGTLVVCGGGSAPEFDEHPEYGEIVQVEEPAEDFAPGLDDEALIVYTSGTTGHPKGVVLTQYNLLVDAEQIAAWHGVGRGDRMMCVLPIHHVNGTVVTLITPLLAGGTAVLNRRFHTGEFFRRLADERIAIVSVVPTLLAFLLQAAGKGEIADPEGLDAFRHIICGAGPLTVDLALQFEDRFGLRIVHGYGLSETTCYSCFLPVALTGDEHRAWLGEHGFPSIGCAIGANEMDILDDRNEPLPEGERGEIVIRGHNVMAGYYRNDEANARAFAGGWFHSGDEGFWRADPEGNRYFFITGRLKELIIRGGVNVSPLEIDEILMNLPGVRAAVSVGFENDMYGEEIGAYVVMQEGRPEDAEPILAACRAALPHHKCPKVVVFGREVPVTSTGKFQRGKLKSLFGEWKSVQFKKSRE